MNYVEFQAMRKEASAFADGMTMMNPFSHMQWMQDQIKRNGFWKAVTGHGDEGFVDYLGRTGKVDLNNEWTNAQRYNQFMNGFTPSNRAIAKDYGTDLTSKLKAFFGIKPLKFGLIRDNKFTKMKPANGSVA